VWIALPTAQDFAKAADMIKKPLFAVSAPEFPGNCSRPEAAESPSANPTDGDIALAPRQSLTELQATGDNEAQKGALAGRRWRRSSESKSSTRAREV